MARTGQRGSAKALDFTVKRTVDDSTSYSHFTGLKIDGKTVAASVQCSKRKREAYIKLYVA